MEEKINLPDMGEGVESATVASLLVRKGDTVEVDQGIVELETDKAVAEVPCPKAGKVKDIHVEPDQEVEPGDLLITLETGEEGEQPGKGGEAEQAEEKEAEREPSGREQGKPETGEEEPQPDRPAGADAKEREQPESDQEGEDEEPESSGEKPKAGKPAGKEQGKGDEGGDRARTVSSVSGAGGSTAGTDIPAAPSTRRLARELGVDLRQVEGSGEDGWITESDVKAAARQTASGAGRDKAEGEGESDRFGPIRREKMRSIRRTIARRMHESQAATAHVTHFDDADITDLEAFRRQTNRELEEMGEHPGLLAYILRAVVDALKLHPIVNASLDLDAGEVIYKEYIGLGLAVDTDRGLIVPVIRNAECMSIIELAHGVADAVEKARSGEFETDDLQGGTFSVSNLGSVGGRYATPVINHPESAILLLGRSREEPVAVDGDIKVRTILPLSLTYDHRLIDGADAQRFLNDVVAVLESPTRLLTQ